MRRERVSEDIYIFTSEMYAQVTASVILTEEGAIVIDTLPFPSESREMAEFVHRRHRRGARYVINTHFHADHVYGNYLYPEAQIIAHRKCRELLRTIAPQQLEEAKEDTPEIEEVEIVAPNIVFDNEMGLHLGERSLHLIHFPGHSEDGVGLFAEGDRILFAGDAVMPIPYFGAGDFVTMRRSLQRVAELNPENIVQGHGDTLLRGEIPDLLERHISYLDCIEERVQEVVERGGTVEELQEISLESCGESPIPLDGLVKHLHQGNLARLYNDLQAQNA